MSTFFLVFLLFLQTGGGLEERVAAYWDALVRRDKPSALELVSRDTRQAFLDRREPLIRSWKLEQIERRSGFESVVTVELEQAFGRLQSFHATRVVETWVVEEGAWRVRVTKPDADTLLQQFRTPRSPEPKPQDGKLAVVPDVLRIHFLNSPQTGGVRIANGLDQTLRVLRVEFDSELFRLAEHPSEILPGTSGRLVLEYIGTEISKDRRSDLRVVVRTRDFEQALEVPVLYNYISPGARALFGLTDEQAETLKREDPLVPRVHPPPPKPPLRPQ